MKAAITNPWTFITLCLALPVTLYSAIKWYDVFYSKPAVYQKADLNHLGDFVNQDNQQAGKFATGKITVVNLFFTSCPVVCVKMMREVKRVHDTFNDQSLQFVSVSVDPQTDSAARMQWYIKKMHINDDRWQLVSGTRQATYSFARNDLKLVAAAANDAGDFIHSDQIVLIDGSGNVRGFYNSAEQSEVNKLINDINKIKP